VLLGAIVAVLAAAPRADAQFYFGQNQVQYDSFDWKVVETDHFLVHYYQGDRPVRLTIRLRPEQRHRRPRGIHGRCD
jgi:hypothetical protein